MQLTVFGNDGVALLAADVVPASTLEHAAISSDHEIIAGPLSVQLCGKTKYDRQTLIVQKTGKNYSDLGEE